MSDTVVVVKKNKKKQRIIFAILCVLIVLLLCFNIWSCSMLISKNRKYGSPSFLSDDVIGYVKAGGEWTKNTLTFEDEMLFPGTAVAKSIMLENVSNKNLYVRLYAKIEFSTDGINFEEKDFVELLLNGENEDWQKGDEDGKVYYLNMLKGSETATANVSIKIYNHLQNEDFEEKYKDSRYKLEIVVETKSTNAEFDKANSNIENFWK